jgi:hypothetical protein
VLGEGDRVATVRRSLGFGTTGWAAPELRQVFEHLGQLYERTSGQMEK